MGNHLNNALIDQLLTGFNSILAIFKLYTLVETQMLFDTTDNYKLEKA